MFARQTFFRRSRQKAKRLFSLLLFRDGAAIQAALFGMLCLIPVRQHGVWGRRRHIVGIGQRAAAGKLAVRAFADLLFARIGHGSLLTRL
jgi:hypothetical protein